MLLRRLTGPLTLWDAKDQAAFVEWQAEATAGLLDGLAPTQVVTSPRGFKPVNLMSVRLTGRGLSTTIPCGVRLSGM
jgi:hypothetical protein